MHKGRIWTRNFITLTFINLSLTMVLFLLIVIIASYAVDQFNAPLSIGGLISGIFIIGVLIGRLLTGRFIHIIGNKKTLFIGLVFFIITTSFYFLTWNLPSLFIIRIIQGFSFGIASTAASTMVALIIPETRRGEGIGYYSLSPILSTALGPFIGILFMNLFDNNYNYIFAFNSLLAFVCLLLAFTINIKDAEIVKAGREPATKGMRLKNFLEPKAIPVGIVALLVGFCYSSIMAFISFYTEEINLMEAGSVFFLFYAIVIIISRPFTGPLMDKRGENIIIYPSLFIYALGMLLYSLSHHEVMILLAASLIGLGYGNFNSIAQAVAINSTTPNRFGVATSTYYIFFDFGLGIGPFVIGSLVPIIGYRSVYLVMTIIIILSLLLYYFVHGKKQSMKIKEDKLVESRSGIR